MIIGDGGGDGGSGSSGGEGSGSSGGDGVVWRRITFFVDLHEFYGLWLLW